MQTPLLRTFDDLEEASAAVAALRAAGLPPGSVELRVLQDEAGPGAGNFVAGNGETTHGGSSGPTRPEGNVPYDQNFRAPSYRAGHLVLVAPEDEKQSLAAEQVLERFNAVPVEENAAKAE